MTQEKINYKDIIDLGFEEVECYDSVYEALYGYPYCHITKHLTKKIYLDWEKETRRCKMVRIDSAKTCNIMAETPIMNLEQVKTLIDFFSDEEKKVSNYPDLA